MKKKSIISTILSFVIVISGFSIPVAGTVAYAGEEDPVITAWPTVSYEKGGESAPYIFAGESVGWGATLSGGEASVPGAFAFVTPGARPGAGIYSAPVRFTPEDSEQYNAVVGVTQVEVRDYAPIEISENRLAVVVGGAPENQISVNPGSFIEANVSTTPAAVEVGIACGHCDGAYDEFSCGEECPDQWGFCSCSNMNPKYTADDYTVTPELSIIQTSNPSVATAALEDGVLTVTGISDGTTGIVLQAQFKGISQGNHQPGGSTISDLPLVTAPKTITIVVGSGSAEPSVDSLSPASGVIAGGTSVVITGSNFTGATAVKFGDADAASFTVDSATKITAVAPEGVITDTITDKNNNPHTAPAQKFDVSVTTPLGTSANTALDDYIYYTLTVTVGGVVNTYSLADLQERAFVTGKGGSHSHSDPDHMVHSSTDTFVGTSVFDLMQETGGGIPVGYSVVANTADGFRGNFSYDQVKNGAFKFMNLHSEVITAKPGPKAKLLLVYSRNGNPLNMATEGPVRTGVVGDDGQITDGNLWSMWVTSLEVAPPKQPVITKISPAAGPFTGGNTVTVTGLDFAYATEVKFGDVPAADFSVVSSTEIRVKTPPSPVGPVNISVTTPGGTTINGSANAFIYNTIPIYKVVFEALGGIVSETQREIPEGNPIGTLPAPTRANYVFGGWYTAIPGGVKIAADTPVTANATYYAQWLPIHTVTFHPNKGTVSEASRKVTSGSAVGSLPAPKKSGHKFLGWYTKASGGTKIAKTAKVTKDVTYYAQWQINQYKATFKANGGKADKASIKKNYNSKIGTLPAAKREGYKFLGWYTAKNGGTKIVKTTKITKNVTYYAHWKRSKK